MAAEFLRFVVCYCQGYTRYPMTPFYEAASFATSIMARFDLYAVDPPDHAYVKIWRGPDLELHELEEECIDLYVPLTPAAELYLASTVPGQATILKPGETLCTT